MAYVLYKNFKKKIAAQLVVSKCKQEAKLINWERCKLDSGETSRRLNQEKNQRAIVLYGHNVHTVFRPGVRHIHSVQLGKLFTQIKGLRKALIRDSPICSQCK